MNKQYLKENGLYEAHKQFMRLCEWSYSPSGLDEEDNTQQDPMGGASQGGADPMPSGQDPMGGADPMASGQDPMGGADPIGGGQDPMMGTDPMGGAPQGDTDPMASGQDPMGGADPMVGDPMGEDPMGEEGDDDDVIDVDDLTNAQEKINKKVNHVGKDVSAMDTRINQLMTALDKMERMINTNNDKIEKLNAEFQNRVKTPTEKLNLRSLDSYPFNVKPTEYWDKATKDMPQYSVADNNDMPTDKEYTITQSDIDGASEKQVEDSFKNNWIDDNMRQDINKIFGL